MNKGILNKILTDPGQIELERAKELIQRAEKLVGDCPHKQMVFILAIIAERLEYISN